MSSRPRRITAAAMIAILFGVLTLKSGGAVLFFDGAARSAAGNYVPFVIWFNFLAGFAYVLAGAGLFLMRGWAASLSILIAIATLIVFAALCLVVTLGTNYELRTVGAMIVRSSVWIVIAAISNKTLRNQVAFS